MSHWKEYKLGEITDINKKSVGKGYSFEIIEYVDTSSVTENKFDNPQIIPLVEAPSRAKRLVDEGDTIISTVRPIQKHYGFIKNSKPNTVVSTGFAVVSPKKIDPKFLYYFLTQEEITVYLNTLAESGTTTFPAFRPEELAKLTIWAPESIEEQTAIASILSSLDQKIELNNAINRNLEALAQALFKQWFVEFEFPVDQNGNFSPLTGEMSEGQRGYKSSGGEMVESELGMIPKGWRVGKLGDILTVKGGTTPSTKEPKYWEGNLHWTSPRDLSTLEFPVLLNTDKKITEEGLKQISSGLLPKGTLLLSSRAPIGYLAITEIETAINQGYIAINCKQPYSNLFMLYWLRQYMESVIARANGSTFLEISKSNFKEIDVIIPSETIHNQFIEVVNQLFKQLVLFQRENNKLSSLRDTLLPKLISGELEVKDV
ncbi:MAG: restriction endonuclease subunit S [Bacteroidales bacterium]|nr:restriction endonuclease subunit S [Bacteroidales bacterium]